MLKKKPRGTIELAEAYRSYLSDMEALLEELSQQRSNLQGEFEDD